MSLKKFSGTGVALITPFTNENTVDFAALDNLIEYVIEGGVDFLVIFGTTGEPVTLTESEKSEILEFIYQHVNGRKPIVVGCGGNNTAETVKAISAIDDTKFDAVLSVSPYYNKPGQRGILEHYKHVAAASKLPVIAYNVPSRTGCNIEVDTAIKIANEIPNIVGLKEASPSVEQFTYIKRAVPKDFLLISGDDSIVVPHMVLGACGAISVTANAAPHLYSSMIRLCLEQNYTEALEIHLKLIEFTDSLFTEGSPAGVKAALAHKGLVKNNLRLPLVPVTAAHEQYIQSLLKQLAL
ncbi:MAG: 4-hydroxy-tetrahydrodipicolinate synthase [Bacteroidales bacterium]|jgi:4-hydroxy-tetrahydrodipicolinate synthase|nr:4-hydroxy-tetrahydrodipicolinate synthase [Bacteroidales bacterium]